MANDGGVVAEHDSFGSAARFARVVDDEVVPELDVNQRLVGCGGNDLGALLIIGDGEFHEEKPDSRCPSCHAVDNADLNSAARQDVPVGHPLKTMQSARRIALLHDRLCECRTTTNLFTNVAEKAFELQVQGTQLVTEQPRDELFIRCRLVGTVRNRPVRELAESRETAEGVTDDAGRGDARGFVTPARCWLAIH